MGRQCFRLDYWNGSSWTSTGTPPNFSGSSVSALTTEANGYIWASSRSGYVDYWNGSSWISTGQPPTATGRTILYATALTYGPNNTVWVGVTDNDSTCYVDYWNGSSWVSADTPTNFNYYVESLTPGPNGSIWAGSYNGYVDYDPDLVSAPTSLTPVTNTNIQQNSTVNFSWTASPASTMGCPITNYEIEIGTTSGGNNVLDQVLGDVTFFLDMITNAPGSVLYWSVRAEDSLGNWSPWQSSNSLNVELNPPTNLTVSNITQTGAILSWTPGSNNPSGTTFTVNINGTGYPTSITSYALTSLQPGTFIV